MATHADDYLTLALGGITRIEAEGQQLLLRSSKLPIDGSLNNHNRERFEALGFIFGARLDDLFVSTTMPLDWRLEPNGKLHNSLLDERGRIRGNVFYKASDHLARVTLFCRFSAGSQRVGGWQASDEKRFEGFVQDCGKVIFTTEPQEPSEAPDYFNSPQRIAELHAKEWLRSNYPDFENVLAYWPVRS